MTLIDALDTLLVRLMKLINMDSNLRYFTSDHDIIYSYFLYFLLQVMGNKTEFVRVADILIDTLDFDRDINVSVFETNIRGC